MNIILCGPPCSGKTYYGKKLAEHQNISFIDTDLLVEDAYELQNKVRLQSRDISFKHGTPAFRQLENLVISQLNPRQKSIIAIGGGALFEKNNAEKLKALGTIILINTPFSTLWERVLQKSAVATYIDEENPMASFEKVVLQRMEVCLIHAKHSVDTYLRTDNEVIALLSTYV